MRRTLADFTVPDLTNVLAGAYRGHQLAHMGAPVIKIESPPDGDRARQLGADPQLDDYAPRVAGAPPPLGEHTEELLAEFGMAAATLARRQA